MASGFIVPSDQPDGVYGVSCAENGTETHTLLARALSEEEFAQLTARNAHEELTKPPSRIVSRQSDATYCGSSQQNLDPGSTDKAVGALKDQCKPGAINSGLNFYSKSGSTVVYICNYGSNAWLCTRDDLTRDYAQITSICGRYKSGWRVRWPQGNTGAQTGYETVNAKFCVRGA